MTAIRVLVVDDSALVRRLIRSALLDVDDIEIVGLAKDGVEAVEMVDELDPDVVTLDIEMPRLDGLGALEQIHERHPRTPVIMFSTLTERGAAATLEALSRGASDYVTKPSNTGSVAEGLASVREQLVPRIRALVGMRKLAPAPRLGEARRGTAGTASAAPAASAASAAPAAVRAQPASRPRVEAPPEVLLIGCSTGGPDALAQLLAALPGSIGVPVLVVQHMPPVFTTMLAQRLDKLSPLTVREAADGDVVQVGEVLLAPGDHHLRVGLGGRVTLDQGPRENFCRPAVDVLFRSAVDVYGGRAVVVVLTGMGQDGLLGAQALRAHGARVIVQDEQSSVVWGMPGAIAMAGEADQVLPLSDVPAAIMTAVKAGRVPA